jgi:hypothetical protein
MENYTEVIANLFDGTTVERKYTQKEVNQAKILAKEFEDHQLKLDKEAEAKATARQAILDRLGLTADEAAILLG